MIAVHDLVKKYGAFTAVDGVSSVRTARAKRRRSA
jgi:aspartate aminotransferase-like enzyme